MNRPHDTASGAGRCAPTAVAPAVANGRSQPTLDSLMELGIGGVTVKPGDHICAFYRGAAGRDEILIPYFAKGLEDGDKCICIVDGADRRGVMDRLQTEILHRGGAMDNQLEVLDFGETYLRGGRFSQEEWFDHLDQSMSRVIREEGYTVARVSGDAAFAVIETCPVVDELMAYEAKVNWFAPRYPQILLCLYDLELFTGELVIDVLKTHPKVLLNNMVVENPYYVKPEEFLATRG
jgi:hypothetical protein